MAGILACNRTRSDNLGAYVCGVSDAPPGPFRLPQIAAGAGRPAAALRRLLDEVPLDESALRAALIASVPAAELRALLIESTWVDGCDQSGIHVFSISGVTAAVTAPIGWAIVKAPPVDEPDSLLSELENRAIVDLVRQAGRDYMVAEPGAFENHGAPPLVVRDPWFGTDGALRTALGASVAEYVTLINGDDVLPAPLRTDPYDFSGPGRPVADYFLPLPADGVPRVREILGASPTRRGREYVTATGDGNDATFAIVRPFVAAARGSLLGPRPGARAAALAELADSIGDTSCARRLRVSDFRHPTATGLRRHALLVSCLDAMLTGHLAPEAMR